MQRGWRCPQASWRVQVLGGTGWGLGVAELALVLSWEAGQALTICWGVRLDPSA